MVVCVAVSVLEVGKTLLSAGYAEIQQVIREVEPQEPSTRISTLKGELPSVAAKRKTEPRRLSRLVQCGLDWIVMKCLEKDRTAPLGDRQGARSGHSAISGKRGGTTNGVGLT